MKTCRFKIVCCLSTAAACAATSEYGQRSSLGEVADFAARTPLPAILNLLSLLLLLAGLIFLLRRFWTGLLLSAGSVLLLAEINDRKLRLLDMPLLPPDLRFARQIFELSIVVSTLAKWIIAAALITLVFAAGWAWKRERSLALGGGQAMLAAFLCLMPLVAIPYFAPTPAGQLLLSAIGTKNMVWNQKLNYKKNGFFFSFLLNLGSAFVPRPEGYSAGALRRLQHKLQRRSSASDSVSVSGQNKPNNIVIYLSEAFWDPLQLKQVSFEPDPLAPLRPYLRKEASGSLLVPSFGGLTSNTVFEVLTGLSLVFLPQGTVPFNLYLSRRIPSIAWVFKQLGYKTSAIYPYARDNRDLDMVYPYLGFDELHDLESFSGAPRCHPYLCDSAVVDKVKEIIAQSNDPVFLLVLTAQNHAFFSEGRFPETRVKVSGADEKTNRILEAYAHGLSGGAEALAELLAWLKQHEETSLLFAFGDHLPLLGERLSGYLNGGFLREFPSEKDRAKQLLLHTTPYFIWSSQCAHAAPVPELLNASYVPSFLLEIVGVKHPLFSGLLGPLRKEFPGFMRKVVVTANGSLLPISAVKESALVKDYQLLQYDLLFGEQYSDAMF